MPIWTRAGFGTPVIGVAKSRIRTTYAVPVVRGSSMLPLFVTAGCPQPTRRT